jgi:PEP-CTERM motif
MHSLSRRLIVSLAFVLLPASAGASIVYVVTGNQQFGTVDLASGAFHQIGPDMPEGSGGLIPGPNGSLLTLTFSGNLDSINPTTGITTVIGATGLGDCTVADGRCPANSANGFGEVGGKLYATDFANNLYSVDPATGAARLIGPIGIPAVPPGFPNFHDAGFISAFDESLFGVGDRFYATFEAVTIDPETFRIVAAVIPEYLYQIDPSTGVTIRGPSIPLGFVTTVDVNGAFYSFNADTGQLSTLDLTNGTTGFVADLDPSAGLIGGAAPVPAVPEPGSIALAGIGIAAIAVFWRRRRDYCSRAYSDLA